MTVPLWAWVAFAAVVLVMLAIDLFAHRDDHVISFRQAAWWSGLWVGLSLVFAGSFCCADLRAAGHLTGGDARTDRALEALLHTGPWQLRDTF